MKGPLVAVDDEGERDEGAGIGAGAEGIANDEDDMLVAVGEFVNVAGMLAVDFTAVLRPCDVTAVTQTS